MIRITSRFPARKHVTEITTLGVSEVEHLIGAASGLQSLEVPIMLQCGSPSGSLIFRLHRRLWAPPALTSE